ncbi:hypothetical protein EPI10_007004 [Gossypium australe]|uniref:Uncharacterized protein n=1 Tax=Gossypium australe TaxID=47621 RepID=A0A5B6WTX6_9ROSI|nr:hypothetical protein EPI10_007004 [Gossypium australe]
MKRVATQVQPLLMEKETAMLFINTLKASFINHISGRATKSFSDIVMSGEMIKNAVKKIDTGENAKRSNSRKKENKVNNASTYNKSYLKLITVGPPRTVTTSHQGLQESNPRPNTERFQFTLILMTYRELYQSLFDVHVVSLFYLKPMQPPFPRWYGANAQYEYHTGITGHSIENCTTFKKLIERFIKMGIVKFDDPLGPNVAGNPLPSHSDKGVNVIIESGGKRTKMNVVELKTPLEWFWKKMVEEGLIKQDSEERPKRMRNYSEFHAEEEAHRSALMKVLNETYVSNDISVNKLDRLVNNISAGNFIFFNEDEILPGGMGSTKALYITTRCKGYTLPGVLIDNRFALNALPLSTLNRLPVDSSHMKTCQNIVRAFDGTERRVMGGIEIPLLIGSNTYEVDFLVMDIKPSYNCLLERHWIHSAGVVSSSLHQKLKLVTEGRLVTINTEEDIIASVTSDAPYIRADDEAIEYSF